MTHKEKQEVLRMQHLIMVRLEKARDALPGHVPVFDVLQKVESVSFDSADILQLMKILQGLLEE